MITLKKNFPFAIYLVLYTFFMRYFVTDNAFKQAVWNTRNTLCWHSWRSIPSIKTTDITETSSTKNGLIKSTLGIETKAQSNLLTCVHFLNLQVCFIVPGPPYFTISLQKLHSRQSSLVQASHSLPKKKCSLYYNTLVNMILNLTSNSTVFCCCSVGRLSKSRTVIVVQTLASF